MKRFDGCARSAAVAAAVVLVATTVWAANPERQPADRLLQRTPAEALFCIRINNLEGALSQANGFLRGIAPDGFDAEGMVLAKLTGLVGGAERMEEVRKRGSFAVFGVMLPSEESSKGPFADLFIGMFVPVRDYDAFVGGEEPAGRGIATIRVDGRPRAVAVRLGRHALLCQANARDKLVRARRLLRGRQGGLRDVLSDQERDLAARSPIWLYANVQKASGFAKPMILGKLEQMKAELKKAKEKGKAPIADVEGIIRFYAALLDMVMSETGSIAAGLAPASDVCEVTFSMTAVPGTVTAETMSLAPQGGMYRKALGYLHDGAIINVATGINGQSWEKSYLRFIDLMPKMMGAEVAPADLEKLREITSRSFRAMGDSASFSFATGDKGPGLFSMQYVLKVKDGAAIEDAIREGLRMTNSEMYRKFLASFGLGLRAEIESDPSMYKGVRINAARLAFEGDDDDSPQTQMVKAMWGGGLDYRWAVLDGYCAYAIGKGADAHARKLIDQIKAGGAEGICTDMKAAMEAIPESAQADTVGTFNYVRMLNATLGSMVLPDGTKLPELNAPTEGNIAFAGRNFDGGFTAWLAVPKQHVMEIKSAFETFGEEMKKIEEQKKEASGEQP